MLCVVYAASKRAELSRALAFALLAEEWEPVAATKRARSALEPPARWVPGLVRAVFAAYHRAPADRPRELTAFIEVTVRWDALAGPAPPRVARWFVPVSAMGRMRWPVPELADVGALGAFLGLKAGELAWLADVRGLERGADDERLRNYRYAMRPRRSSGLPRVVESPKPRLKAAQRQVLHDVLDWIPAHPAAHGFTRGRSVVSHASSHVGEYAVLRIDLEDFFASIAAARVYGIFRAAGYPEAVAHVLTGLTTNAVPPAVLADIARPGDPREPDLRPGDPNCGDPRADDPPATHARVLLRRRLGTPHLPQGAPTSPALANLAAFGLDRRLTGLAASLRLTYTRYADDLTFSGGRLLAERAAGVRATVATIAAEEGFAVNERKTTLATRAGRQTVCGVVVNDRTNVMRAEYDTLKAILHNAACGDPQAQNRDAVPDFRAHLLGRIAWVASLHPSRGAKLRRLHDAIGWEPNTAGQGLEP
jgi:RNA-directed DNA polymerase